MNQFSWLGRPKRRLAAAFSAAVYLALSAAAFSAAPAQYWQLTVLYDDQSLRLLEAEAIAPMAKRPTTPGLTGAPAKIDYAIDWLDAGGAALASTSAEFPVGMRAAFQPGQACQTNVPPEGVFVVRVEGPAIGSAPKSLRLRKKGVRGVAALGIAAWPTRAFAPTELALPIERLNETAAIEPLVQGPKGVAKIRDTGADGNRLVIVVMGDGYTAANLSSGAFTTNAGDLLGSFLALPPWDTYFAATNVYRVDVESNQAGADRENTSTSPIVDTYFNSTFWSFGIDRLLTIDSVGMTRAIAAADSYVGAGVWDHIFMLVNSLTYGGSGGPIPVASIESSSDEVILHEFGHSFVNLADEYEDPYPGFPPGDSEPNVDYNSSGAGLKWLDWVDGGTPLPTPETGAYASVVGAFQGARYLSSGIYRPWLDCLMRSLGQPFCPVCAEAHVQSFCGIVSLADSASPAFNGTVGVPPAGGTISVTPWPIAGVTYQWAVNGIDLAGETGASVTLFPSDLPSPPDTVRLTMRHPTSLVRLQPISEQFTWTAQAAAGPTPTAGISPTPTPSLTPSISPSPTPFNSASFLSDSIPAQVFTGETLYVGFTMQNLGNTTWTQGGGHALGILSDSCGAFAAQGNRVYMYPGDAAPPATASTFVAQLTAPAVPGACMAQFRMVQENIEFFGPSFQVSFDAIDRPNASGDWLLYD